jgi:predicted nucleic acid-binding protein
MSASFFLDTNILLYCLDPADLRKRKIARMLVDEALDHGNGAISYQVCHELCQVILHKLPDTIPRSMLLSFLETTIFELIKVSSSPRLILEGVRIQQQTQYHFYDSLIVAAAIEAGAEILYTEDFQDGRQFGSLKIVNPFL